MLRGTIFSLVALFLVPGLALQVPLGSSYRWQDGQTLLGDQDLTDWSFNQLPDPNDTDNLVFETAHALLQHWPNTRMRNGHNIIPGIIEKGTLLYHGGDSDQFPLQPDWVTTDPEHSYFFCRDGPRSNHLQQGCWHFTLSTLRPLKIIYFDGSSAAKIPYGSLDTQDLLAFGETGAHDVFDEKERIDALCKWGRPFGVDGFVRMEMDFEIVLCDFSRSVSVVSLMNLVNRRSGPPDTAPSTSFEAINSGSWHNRFPGETRIQVDLTGLVSFYDTELVPSLVAVRAGQERWDHRVRDISSKDWSAVKARLEEYYRRPTGLKSGYDWRTLIQVIVDRFAGRLELIRYLLNSSATDPAELLDLAFKTQTQLRIMLTPYILVSDAPADPSATADLDWTRSIFKLCGVTHTYVMVLQILAMTESEKLLFKAVRGTSREICRVVTKMWAAGVYAGIDPTLNKKESLDIAQVARVWHTWAEDLNYLMTWLDWSVWVKCDPGCDPEEMCYLPTWPVGFPRGKRGHGPPHPERLDGFDLRSMAMESLAEEMSNSVKPDSDDWIRPQPRCVRRVAPYER